MKRTETEMEMDFKEATALLKSAKAVTTFAAEKGVNITQEELVKLVKSQAASVADSRMADSSTFDIENIENIDIMAITSSYIFSMYYRLCDKLKIKIEENILKALGSAFAEEMFIICGYQMFFSMIFLQNPSIGNRGVAITNALVGYVLTYYSGITFMIMMTNLFYAGLNPEDMTEEQLKKAMKDAMEEIDFEEIKIEAWICYRNRKNNDGAVTF